MELTIIILILVIIISIIDKKMDKKDNKNDYNIYISRNVEGKKTLLTKTEQQFYKMIKEICNKYELNIFVQVALNQIIKAKDKKTFYQIGAKTIDFVITDKETNIKICIELDDHSHDEEKRKKRDNIVNQLCKNANIKILRIPIDNAFIIDRIEKMIKESL